MISTSPRSHVAAAHSSAACMGAGRGGAPPAGPYNARAFAAPQTRGSHERPALHAAPGDAHDDGPRRPDPHAQAADHRRGGFVRGAHRRSSSCSSTSSTSAPSRPPAATAWTPRRWRCGCSASAAVRSATPRAPRCCAAASRSTRPVHRLPRPARPAHPRPATRGLGAAHATGYDALLHSALKGKGAMAPQGGGDFSDYEIGARGGLPGQPGRRQVRRTQGPGRGRQRRQLIRMLGPLRAAPPKRAAFSGRGAAGSRSAPASRQTAVPAAARRRPRRSAAMPMSSVCTRPKPRSVARNSRPCSSSQAPCGRAGARCACAGQPGRLSSRQTQGAASSST
jgi:hypothetical protein